MKKKIILPIIIVIGVLFSAMSASAATETFVDEVEDGFPKAHSWSERMCFQYNEDLECTTLVKQSDTGSPSTDEYIIYRMDSDITGFSLDCMHVNGLGDGLTDLKVSVSADCAQWTEVSLNATEQAFDDEIYIDFDHAYWLSSTVSNKSAVPAGCQFIKIEILPFTVPESCTWNTVIDTVTITVNKAEEPVADASSNTSSEDIQPDDSTTVSDTASESSEIQESSQDTNTVKNDNSVSTSLVIIICAVSLAVIAVAVVIVLFVLKSKKPAVDTEQDGDKQ